MAKSKSKGNAFEREFASYLTKLFSRNFKRNLSGSGAYVGGGNSNRKFTGMDTSQLLNHLGDIIPPTGYYVISECKSYKDFPFHMLLSGGAPKILSTWLSELIFDSSLVEGVLEPILPHWLTFKINLKGTYIVIPKLFFEGIFTMDLPILSYFHCQDGYGGYYYIMGLDIFSQFSEEVEEVITDKRFFKSDILEFRR